MPLRGNFVTMAAPMGPSANSIGFPIGTNVPPPPLAGGNLKKNCRECRYNKYNNVYK